METPLNTVDGKTAHKVQRCRAAWPIANLQKETVEGGGLPRSPVSLRPSQVRLTHLSAFLLELPVGDVLDQSLL